MELGLIAALGFLGSFGHCVGMCGPLTVAFSLAAREDGVRPNDSQTATAQWRFHLLLNLGRLTSYVLVGAAIGGLGSVLVASGQMAGIGSLLRRTMALLTGSLLIFIGLRQLAPHLLPQLPLLHPLQGRLHQRLHAVMGSASQSGRWWTPLLLGLAWGLIPCGFLYTAQLKAAATSSLGDGAATMLAFGLGTIPMMLGLGTYSAWLSRDRTSQLFQFGGWITLLIGILTLARTGDLMVDYAGHGALICLGLALVARPLQKLWPALIRCRRLLGVAAFVLALAHTLHMVEHSWGWNWAAFKFMLVQHQWGVVVGGMALLLMVPLVLTSTDGAQRALGSAWRSLHLLSIPALLLGAIHSLLIGPSYFGNLQVSGAALLHSALLGASVILVLAVRSHWAWHLFGLLRWYTPALSPRPKRQPSVRSASSEHHG